MLSRQRASDPDSTNSSAGACPGFGIRQLLMVLESCPFEEREDEGHFGTRLVFCRRGFQLLQERIGWVNTE